jgi:hypothetical protein
MCFFGPQVHVLIICVFAVSRRCFLELLAFDVANVVGHS